MSLVVIEGKDKGKRIAVIKENVDYFEEHKETHTAIVFNNGTRMVVKVDFDQLVRLFDNQSKDVWADGWE